MAQNQETMTCGSWLTHLCLHWFSSISSFIPVLPTLSVGSQFSVNYMRSRAHIHTQILQRDINSSCLSTWVHLYSYTERQEKSFTTGNFKITNNTKALKKKSFRSVPNKLTLHNSHHFSKRQRTSSIGTIFLAPFHLVSFQPLCSCHKTFAISHLGEVVLPLLIFAKPSLSSWHIIPELLSIC